MSIKITSNYSPNFNPIKRKLNQIKFLVFHYTGMRNDSVAIEKLTNARSNVSCHYFVRKNGEILLMVPGSYIAWHAGKSSWKQLKSINKYSIGIEISNPGHEHNYKPFSKKQTQSLIKLSKTLIKKYKINSKHILGHSDVAPERKKDPGEKFPWQFLSKKKIGIWHDLNQNKINKQRGLKISKLLKSKFINSLHKIGYPSNSNIVKEKNTKNITIAFQRRFRQELVNGKIDKECLLISENLTKKLN